MISTRSLLAACAALMLIATPVLAQETANYKIGVVDLKQVFDSYKKQIDEYAKLRTERDTMQKPIDELSKTITADKDKYDKEKDKMGDDAKRALEEKIEAAVTRYKAEFERAQQDIDRKEKKLMRDLFEEIYMAIQEVGAQGDYHLIFESGDSGAAMPGRLLYSSSTLNMTQKVIDHVNSKYKP